MTSQNRRSMLGGIAGAVLASHGLPALAQASGKPTPKRGGTLTMTGTNEPARLQAALDTSTAVQLVASKIHSGLLNYNPDYSLRPDLATAWQVAPDGLSIRFALRKGVRWHDGKPFTAEDVKFTFEEVIKKYHPRGRGVFASLSQVEIVDEHTVIMRLAKPTPYIMSVLFSAETPIVPKHIYSNGDIARNPANAAPIGTGPFMFKEWKRGSHIILERNPDYFEPGRPYLDRIVHRIIPDPSARSVAFESGEVDLAYGWPVALPDLGRLVKLPHIGVSREGSKLLASMEYLEFNLRDPMFQDVRVRRAMAHAIDLKTINKMVYMDWARPATGHISESVETFYSRPKTHYEFDPKRAEQLLDEAGKKRGAGGVRFSFTIEPAPYGERYTQTAEYLVQALGRVGIKVSVRQQDVASWQRRVYTSREAQAYNYGIANMMDPTIGVQRQYWSKAIRDGVPFSNGSGYKNARIDEIFEAAMVEPSNEQRRKLFAEAQSLLMDELPNIPLIMADILTLYNRRVQDVMTDLNGPHGTFADVWVST